MRNNDNLQTILYYTVLIAKVKNSFEIKNIDGLSLINIATNMKKTGAVEKLSDRVIGLPQELDSSCKDSTLIKRVSEGDAAAFALLYRGSFETLYKFASRKLPSEIEAQYIIEDLFKDLWNNRATLNSSKEPGEILFEALKNKIIRYYAKTFFK